MVGYINAFDLMTLVPLLLPFRSFISTAIARTCDPDWAFSEDLIA